MSEQGVKKPFVVIVETSIAAWLGCLVGSHGWGCWLAPTPQSITWGGGDQCGLKLSLGKGLMAVLWGVLSRMKLLETP